MLYLWLFAAALCATVILLMLLRGPAVAPWVRQLRNRAFLSFLMNNSHFPSALFGSVP